jgi:hypothetical protein
MRNTYSSKESTNLANKVLTLVSGLTFEQAREVLTEAQHQLNDAALRVFSPLVFEQEAQAPKSADAQRV